MTTLTTRHFATRAELDAALAERLGRCLADSQVATAAAAVMLSGGTTPLPAYRALAQRRIVPGAQLHVLFSDERYVPATSPASNYHQSEPLLQALALPAERVLRVRTELPLAAERHGLRSAGLPRCCVRRQACASDFSAWGRTAIPRRCSARWIWQRARGHLAIAVQRPDGTSAVSVTPRVSGNACESWCSWWPAAASDDAIAALIGPGPEAHRLGAVQQCAAVELWVQQD